MQEDMRKNRFVSERTVLGNSGKKTTLAYGKVTFLDNGCFDLYGNVTLTIDTIYNQKNNSSEAPYEFKAVGDPGENGTSGIEPTEGKDGTATEVAITIGRLEGTIRVVSVGGDGGNGGNGVNGLAGGAGGDAALSKDETNIPKGGAGGDGSDGRGTGKNGGKGGKGPSVTIEYKEKIKDAKIETIVQKSAGGAGGVGGKGGAGGKGGLNGDGLTYAECGRDGKSCGDGEPGEPGDDGKFKVKCIDERSDQR